MSWDSEMSERSLSDLAGDLSEILPNSVLDDLSCEKFDLSREARSSLSEISSCENELKELQDDLPNDCKKVPPPAPIPNSFDKPPYSCMNKLVKEYMTCNENIPKDKRQAAYNAFVNVTGLEPVNWQEIFNIVSGQQFAVYNANALFIYLPVLFVLLVVIWVLVGVKWISWVAGLFWTVFVFAVLYGCSIFYRMYMADNANNQNNALQKIALSQQSNFQNSLVYYPQGLFAMACAVTECGEAWECNENGVSPTPCPGTKPKPSSKPKPESKSSFSSSSVSEVSKPLKRKVLPKVLPKPKQKPCRKVIKAKQASK